jgi:hypothetical protein
MTFEYAVDCRPRYHPHTKLYEIVSRGWEVYAAHLRRFAGCAAEFAAIASEARSPREPHWNNGFFTGIDAIALHGLLAYARPARYFEIGSGNSTKFARNAIQTHGLSTRVISIDREPRAEIDSLCDLAIREGLETADLAVFDELESGDILFIDGSHQCFMNSDVTVAFLDVLPRLKPGVWVHFHDIFLPWDYPVQWAGRYYSEQYLLACWLLADSPRFQVELPNCFISRHPALLAELDPIYSRLPEVQNHGGSFWIRMR